MPHRAVTAPHGPVVLTVNGGAPWRAWFCANVLPSPPFVSRDHDTAWPLDARTQRAPEPQLRSSHRCRSAHDQQFHRSRAAPEWYFELALRSCPSISPPSDLDRRGCGRAQQRTMTAFCVSPDFRARVLVCWPIDLDQGVARSHARSVRSLRTPRVFYLQGRCSIAAFR